MMTTKKMTTMTWKVTTKRKPTRNRFSAASRSFPSFRGIFFLTLALLAGWVAAANSAFAHSSAFPGEAANALQGNHKPSPNDCLLYATVFTEEGFLLPGADIYVHPVGKKKPVWEATSDRRGEFAVRVPPDGDYEIEVKAKGYIMQTHTVTAQLGERLDMTFHMPHQPPKK
jgi:hypothetical protein